MRLSDMLPNSILVRERACGIRSASEEEIIAANAHRLERMKIIIEPSSAVSTAPLLKPAQ